MKGGRRAGLDREDGDADPQHPGARVTDVFDDDDLSGRQQFLERIVSLGLCQRGHERQQYGQIKFIHNAQHGSHVTPRATDS